jgi:hypothetical protein
VFRFSDLHAVILLLGLSLVLWGPRLKGPVDLRYDAGVYYILGSSISEGKGYRLLNEPGEIQAIQYPPLLPVIVAVHQWILGTQDPGVVAHVLRISQFLVFTLYIAAVYWMARQFLVPIHAMIVGMITGLYLFSYYLADLLFAEIPFALVATLFFILNRKSEKKIYCFLTILAGFTAYLFRTVGIALLFAWVGESFFHKKWKQGIFRLGVSLVPVIAWQSYIGWVISGNEYKNPVYDYQRASYQFYNVSYIENLLMVDSFKPELGAASPADIVVRFTKNLRTIPRSLGEGISSKRDYWHSLQERIKSLADLENLGLERFFPTRIASGLLYLVGFLVMGGLVLLLVQREVFIPVFIAGSVGLMCLTPWPEQFPRYMTPLTPFLALAFVKLLVAVSEFCKGRWRNLGKWAGIGFLDFGIILVLAVEIDTAQQVFNERRKSGSSYFFYEGNWQDYDKSLSWLKEKVRPGEIIATWSPHWVYLWTGHKAVMPPMEGNPIKGQQLLDSVPIKYVILDNLSFLPFIEMYTEPTIMNHPNYWKLVYTSPTKQTRIYQRTERRD